MAPGEQASRRSFPVHAMSAPEELGRKKQHLEENDEEKRE